MLMLSPKGESSDSAMPSCTRGVFQFDPSFHSADSTALPSVGKAGRVYLGRSRIKYVPASLPLRAGPVCMTKWQYMQSVLKEHPAA
jgi:hypothetical protein